MTTKITPISLLHLLPWLFHHPFHCMLFSSRRGRSGGLVSVLNKCWTESKEYCIVKINTPYRMIFESKTAKAREREELLSSGKSVTFLLLRLFSNFERTLWLQDNIRTPLPWSISYPPSSLLLGQTVSSSKPLIFSFWAILISMEFRNGISFYFIPKIPLTCRQ